MLPDLDERLAVLTTLSEPLRRALYLYVVTQRQPVSRARAAAAQGVPRTPGSAPPRRGPGPEAFTLREPWPPAVS